MNKAVEKKVIDKEALKQKYMEERNKRLRPDGNAQYIRIENQLSHYLDDPYVPFKERAPKTDHVTVAFIGGGYAGLVTGARLVEQGHQHPLDADVPDLLAHPPDSLLLDESIVVLWHVLDTIHHQP